MGRADVALPRFQYGAVAFPAGERRLQLEELKELELDGLEPAPELR
jgi:hypothetical protein